LVDEYGFRVWQPAINFLNLFRGSFYRAMGAEFLDEWRNVRVSGEALQRLAGVEAAQ
jgi:hypothetical protein